MRKTTASINLFDWSKFTFFTGAEGDGGDSGDGTKPDPDPEGGVDDPTDTPDGGEGGDDAPDDKDTEGLKSALSKERKARRDAEKELRTFRKEREDRENADKSELTKAQERLTKRDAQVTALANRLRDSAVNSAITTAATALKFRDMDDALRLVERSGIEIDQDEDTPENVEVDVKSVQAAVQALAKAKPHLLIAGGDEDPSGGKFGGKKKTSSEADEEALKKRYPAL